MDRVDSNDTLCLRRRIVFCLISNNSKILLETATGFRILKFASAELEIEKLGEESKQPAFLQKANIQCSFVKT